MDIIEQFFRAHYSNMQEHYLEFKAEEHGLTKSNYWEVVMKPSEIADTDFEPIQQRIGMSLPQSFKQFYKSYYSLEKDFDTGGLFIAGNKEGSNLASLQNYLTGDGIFSEVRAFQLLPFGLYNDTWYVCLDMNSNEKDPEIVLFELSNWSAGIGAISHRKWFSNFSSFLQCITDQIITGSSDNFDKIDPGNNYLTAYDYWIR